MRMFFLLLLVAPLCLSAAPVQVPDPLAGGWASVPGRFTFLVYFSRLGYMSMSVGRKKPLVRFYRITSLKGSSIGIEAREGRTLTYSFDGSVLVLKMPAPLRLKRDVRLAPGKARPPLPESGYAGNLPGRWKILHMDYVIELGADGTAVSLMDGRRKRGRYLIEGREFHFPGINGTTGEKMRILAMSRNEMVMTDGRDYVLLRRLPGK